MEKKVVGQDEKSAAIFNPLNQLVNEQQKPIVQMGYKPSKKEK